MGDLAEREILLLVARESSPERDDALGRALAALANWENLLALSSKHGLVQLLARAMEEPAWNGSVPALVAQRVRALHAAFCLRSEALLGTLGRMIADLECAGVRPIVLKGPALACTVYPEPSLRTFGDLDLLCPVAHLAEAAVVLTDQGYHAHPRSEREQDGFHVVYARETGGPPIELHGDLLQLGLPARCTAVLWRDAECFQVGGQSALMLGLEYQILHLCVHLHTHGYSRLIWFKDLDLLLRLRGGQVDWQRLQVLAASEGVSLSVRHALLLLGDLLKTPLPTGCLEGFTRDPLGEAAHAVLWPHGRVERLAGKQRLRSLRFNPHRGLPSIVPSLIVMGRRREKLAMLAFANSRRSRVAGSHDGSVKP